MKVERRLAISRERSLIEDAIIDYTNALDFRDNQRTFLELWNILERLVGSKDPTESKKLTVKRASFLFPDDHPYAANVLKRLVDRRNELVHGRADIPGLEASVHHARQFVERAIEFFLDNRFGFQSHHEFLSFLELPKDVRDVARRMRILSSAKMHLQPPRDRKRVSAPKVGPEKN